MNEIINKFDLKKLAPRDACLWKEWKELDALCSKRRETSANPREPSISYIIRKKNAIGLPIEYEIWYRVRSIIGVQGTERPRHPIFGSLHKMSIVLPNNYPSADGNPIFTFRTDIWHPNIRYSGSFKGHVCLNSKDMGVMASLKDLVLRVERYLKYQDYHAQNIYPFPEDLDVAEWVREEAEPNGWTRFAQGAADSNSPSDNKEVPVKNSTTITPKATPNTPTKVLTI